VSVRNRLAEVREARGCSAADLAAQAGITRQAIYAIEAGTYVPNTAVALRLARILGTTVEDLFQLPGQRSESERTVDLDLLAEDEDAREGQPVQVAQVGARTVGVARSPVTWELPAGDALLVGSGKRARVRLFHDAEWQNRVVVAGCDPGVSVLARHLEKSGVELLLVPTNSSRALQLLKAGLVHVAGSHLRDERTGESNLAAVRKVFPHGGAAVVQFAVWEEGLVVARRNPKSIRGVEDLARRDLLFLNREPGSGSRALVDSSLRRLGIPHGRVRGYDSIARGHLAAAWQVRLGHADCCIATRAAARAAALDFIPLVSERYDLVIRKRHLNLPAVEAVVNTLGRAAFRRELECLGGYDISGSGKPVA
jgi:putative molybdopterin biosynthesis protein